MFRAFIALVSIAPGVCITGCDGRLDEPEPCHLTYGLLEALRIDDVRRPEPVLAGSQFDIRGESFVDDESCVVPEVALVGGGLDIPMTTERLSNNEMNAVLTPAAAELLGSSATFTGDLQVRYRATDESRLFRASFPLTFPLAEAIVPVPATVDAVEVYLNDAVLMTGEGFIGGEEGVTEIVVDGTYTLDTGEVSNVEALRLPAELLERYDRTRASFLWSPLIGGFAPGTFEGTLRPQNVHGQSRLTIVGDPISFSCRQQETVLFGLEPETVSLGQIGQFVGRGFIGQPGTEEGTTTVHIEGTFTPHRGVEEPFERELVGAWTAGSSIQYIVTVTNSEDFLRSIDFGFPRGSFSGTATPVLNAGSERYEGLGVDLTITLGPVRQICWVKFLPGFSDTIELIGLGAAETLIEQRVLERLQDFYTPSGRPESWINVEFRAEEPTDFYEGGYAVLEIGGTDPNGVGVFGYDNTPGKDVGNLRLHDHVGGENATGALDGFGYGGVFVESLLFFSAHPPFDWRPQASPPPDPLFDEIFDPVRDHEVVAGEYPDGASPERLAQIEEAIRVLSNIVADTAAHEFGHSLGLAQPFGGPDEWHNTFPIEGCLMDSGQDRPLEERGRFGENLGSRFCGENLWYLQEILPAE